MKKLLLVGVIIMTSIAVGYGAVSLRGNEGIEAPADKPLESMRMEEKGVVRIKGFKFGPATMQIKKGETVTWVNDDDARHDITPLTESSDFPASTLLKKGESYSHTFTRVGTYEYKCSPHPYMKAIIEVVE